MAVYRLNRAENASQAAHAVSSINSYLGILRQGNEYNTRRRVLLKMEPNAFKYAYIKDNFKIVALKNKYKPRRKTLKRIKDGEY